MAYYASQSSFAEMQSRCQSKSNSECTQIRQSHLLQILPYELSLTSHVFVFGSRRGENKYSYLPLNIGPVSSVLLDTTYCNRLVRIGRGGTSGTCFLFASTNAEEASEYTALMTIPTVKRRSAIGKMGMIMAASLFITFGCAGAENWDLMHQCRKAQLQTRKLLPPL